MYQLCFTQKSDGAIHLKKNHSEGCAMRFRKIATENHAPLARLEQRLWQRLSMLHTSHRECLYEHRRGDSLILNVLY